MAALIMVGPGADWQASGGLFEWTLEWTLEYLIARLPSGETVDELQTIVDNNLGSLWIPDLPEAAQRQVYSLLRHGLVEAAEQELPNGPAKASAIDHLRTLAGLVET